MASCFVFKISFDSHLVLNNAHLCPIVQDIGRIYRTQNERIISARITNANETVCSSIAHGNRSY